MTLRIRSKKDDLRDLGFGSAVADDTGHRMINRDGSFQVKREHLGWRGALSLYHRLLTMRWSSFLLTLLVTFLAINAVFATAFLLLGTGSVSGSTMTVSGNHWWDSFFLSVHTITGVGYGNVVPHGLAANLLMTLESFLGFVFLALTTGVVFARFSRPRASIRFSKSAVIAPYQSGSGFMFRLANGRMNELINVGAVVILSLMEERDGMMKREFVRLPLERDNIALFPLSWTVVHPIDAKSPLAGLSQEDLVSRDVEVLVMMEAIDETYSQSVYARTSYKADEITWGAKFSNVLRRHEKGVPFGIDLAELHSTEPAELPA